MMDGLESFLTTPACFEVRDEYLAYYGRPSPYIFRTPTPFSSEQLRTIGTNGARLASERMSGASVHIIGVASRGIPLATAITMSLGAAHDLEVNLSTIGRDASVEHLAGDQRSAYTILVDNALVSGRTMELVLGRVNSSGVSVNLAMYLFDREEVDNMGSAPADRIAKGFGCEVVSIFTLRDVIEAILDRSDKEVLIGYGQQYGTESLRDYISALRHQVDPGAPQH